MNQYSDFIQYVRRVAKNKQADTAWMIYNNSGDSLMRQVDAYEAGVAGVIPDSWAAMYKEYTSSIDPEYQEYVRLRDKFNKTGA